MKLKICKIPSSLFLTRTFFKYKLLKIFIIPIILKQFTISRSIYLFHSVFQSMQIMCNIKNKQSFFRTIILRINIYLNTFMTHHTYVQMYIIELAPISFHLQIPIHLNSLCKNKSFNQC